MPQTFDRAAEDLGNSIHLEHVNVTIPDQRLATLFYVAGLGLTRDPYLMASDNNMWVNVGRSQFHLPTDQPQVLRGHTGIVISGREALLERLTSVRKKLEDTRFNFSEHNDYVEAMCPWGNRVRCYEPDASRFGRITLGIPYVEFDVPVGAAKGIAAFYPAMLGIPADVVNGDGTTARVQVGKDQYFRFRETDRPIPDYDDHHVQIYITDFSGPYKKLLARKLVNKEDNQYQYRFKDIADLDSGKILFTIEHEVRSATHPLFMRPLINRNPQQNNRNYGYGHDQWQWAMGPEHFDDSVPGRPAPNADSLAVVVRVHLITGSGTLPRDPKNRLEYLRYATTGEARLTGMELLARLPEVGQFASVTVELDEHLPYDQPQQLKALSQTIAARLAEPDVAGIVLTHGTNTIEETAYFLNLTVRNDKPVVIVGAQRPFSTLSSDGPLNLVNAIRVAAEPASRGKGTLVVLNSEINAAREVTKTNTYRVETFQTRELGILGYADPDRIVYYRAPTRRHTTQSQFDLTQIDSIPRVDILYSHAGDDGELARAAVAAGAKGLVIAGTGAGHTQNARKALKQLHDSAGVVIVRSARVGAGRVIRDDNWNEAGFVAADNLNPQKARVLLQLALTQTSKPDGIQQFFDEY